MESISNLLVGWLGVWGQGMNVREKCMTQGCSDSQGNSSWITIKEILNLTWECVKLENLSYLRLELLMHVWVSTIHGLQGVGGTLESLNDVRMELVVHVWAYTGGTLESLNDVKMELIMHVWAYTRHGGYWGVLENLMMSGCGWSCMSRHEGFKE